MKQRWLTDILTDSCETAAVCDVEELLDSKIISGLGKAGVMSESLASDFCVQAKLKLANNLKPKSYHDFNMAMS